VEKLLHGGKHTAMIRVQAEVCLHCGERLYAEETVRYFEQIRNKLRRQETSDFRPVGQFFEVIKGPIKPIQQTGNGPADFSRRPIGLQLSSKRHGRFFQDSRAL